MSDQPPEPLPEDTLLPRDMRRSLPIALLKAREVVMGRFRPMLARHDVSEQQWRVLRALAEKSPCDAAELAERASVLGPSLTRIIKALEDRGLITRARNEVDGRRIFLSLAPKGVALIREVTPESRAIYAELEGRFGVERIDALLDLLGELVALDEGAGPRGN